MVDVRTPRKASNKAGANDSPTAPTVETAAHRRKSIVLFSDGTGNSSAKLFKTNVWRMYEAVDLGLPQGRKRIQIAYYDNGVGTSKIRALAILSGIFGFGLKRNVLAIYRFVCRNYRDGDEIYGFGFSRGAFTIRLVAAMIATQGLVLFESEAELKARSRDVLRRYGAANSPNFVGWIGTIGRAIRDGCVKAKRAVGPDLDPLRTTEPVGIRFVGVWDTVAAYGGPSAEITRAIDNFVYPLTMTDQRLCDKVKTARHALALDDERDAFHPVLWDELDWAQKAEAKYARNDQKHMAARSRFQRRLQQVWFAGTHSDVGGGYPDESLSFVSLLWMIAEAKSAGLRLIKDQVDRVRNLSNSLGPIHNSRGGFASYYRYQPRKIDAFLHPDSGIDRVAQTLIMRDPVLGEKQKPPQGYLLSCQVHESVAARIAFGTDHYAPITLPQSVRIAPYSASLGGAGGNPHVSLRLRNDLEAGDAKWSTRHEALYDLVWWRRAAYFFTTLSSLLLAATPLYAHHFMLPRTVDNRWIFERLTGWTHLVLPDVVQPWVRTFETSPLLFWGLLLAIGIGMAAGAWLEGAIQSRMRSLWQERVDAVATKAAKRPSPLQRLRNSFTYQRAVQLFKWYLLPFYVGIAFVLLIGYALAVLSSQFALSIAEKGICQRTSGPGDLLGEGSFSFDASKLCNSTGLHVRRGHHYAVEFAVPKSNRNVNGAPPERVWRDGPYAASPEGLTAFNLGTSGYVGVPFRRLVDARYMQPLYEIRPPNNELNRRRRAIVRPLELAPSGSDGDCLIYRGDFVPPESGEFFMFVNDAVLPWNLSYFYTGQGVVLPWNLARFYKGPGVANRGTAFVDLYDFYALRRPSSAQANQTSPPRRCS